MGLKDDGCIVALCGEEGTCKTTMALTFPSPISHLDIDVGGYQRAAWRMDTASVVSHSFPKPLTDADIAKMKGLVITDPKASTRAIAMPKKIEGMKELWQNIIDQFVKDALGDPISIIIDSSTLHYKIGCDAYLQELQEKQLLKWKKDNPRTPFDENDYREKLWPIEYGQVYDRLQRIYHTARSYRKYLILIHYPTDEYGPMPDGKGGMADSKTGKIIMDGYKETGKFSDLVMWLSVKSRTTAGKEERYPVAKFTKCGIEGMGLNVLGMEVAASYDDIVNLKNLMQGSKNNA